MNNSTAAENNKAIVLEAFETLFNKRDYDAAARLWSPDYVQHSAHIGPGREGLFSLVRGLPASLRYESDIVVAEGDYVILHGRFSGIGLPSSWIAADIVRLKDGILVEHWDVIEDEAGQAQSKSGKAMFGVLFPATPKNARHLLEEFTAGSFRDPRQAAAMFAEDGVLEMPYLKSLGIAPSYKGRAEIEDFLKFVRDLYPDMDFHNVKIVMETADQALGEYEFTAVSRKTDRMIHQLFLGRLVAENGKIKLLRESLNMVELGLAIYPNGLADFAGVNSSSK
jgi:predicted SnoaL-like aldol condensation-catalyzing enzyme